MEPYYIIMRLPGEAHAEFLLMIPMMPAAATTCRMACRALRRARLRRADRLRVSEGEADLRAVPDRGADRSGYRDLPADSLWNQIGRG